MRRFALAAVITLAGCQQCGSTVHQNGSAQVLGTPAGVVDPAHKADVPEVRDPGPGRATAALRAVLMAYGIAFDAAALARECKVDETGASVDDIEDVAQKYGVDAVQVMNFAEHVLLPEAEQLPAILAVKPPSADVQFWLAWRTAGDHVQIMDPAEGRRWMPRSDLQKLLYIHETPVSAARWQEGVRGTWYENAERARMMALGLKRAEAQALMTRAAAIPEWHALGALDATIRSFEALPQTSRTPSLLASAYECAQRGACANAPSVAPEHWSVRPAPRGPQNEEMILLRGVVTVTVTRRPSR